MKNNPKAVLILTLLVLLLLAWAPWMDGQDIHDKVFRKKAHKDGTMGWVHYPNGIKSYELICDYKVSWLPFGRLVGSCEGIYYVTFWGKIIF